MQMLAVNFTLQLLHLPHDKGVWLVSGCVFNTFGICHIPKDCCNYTVNDKRAVMSDRASNIRRLQMCVVAG